MIKNGHNKFSRQKLKGERTTLRTIAESPHKKAPIKDFIEGFGLLLAVRYKLHTGFIQKS